jgi:hypothetical protein
MERSLSAWITAIERRSIGPPCESITKILYRLALPEASSNDRSRSALNRTGRPLMSKHVTISTMRPRTASRSGSRSKPKRIAPIVAMRTVRCLSLPQTLTSWCPNPKVGGSNPPPSHKRHCPNAVVFACLLQPRFPKCAPQISHKSGIPVGPPRAARTHMARQVESAELARVSFRRSISCIFCTSSSM